jgi:hypothetical protein
MMKTPINISILTVVVITLLSSCSLLVSSPLPSSDYLTYYEEEEEEEEDVLFCQTMVAFDWNNDDVYSEVFEIPVDGGYYEFECEYDQFYISKIFDSSLPCALDLISTQVFLPVNAWIYNGPFYTITCDTRRHTWRIEVEPFIPLSGMRQIWVLMWPGFDQYNYVFQFEQGYPDV